MHGGDLSQAMREATLLGLDAGKASEWLDLSTGINPNPYPISKLPDDIWQRLPGQPEQDALLAAAAAYYGAPSTDHIIAVPGTALAIQVLPHLFHDIAPGKPVLIAAPTYGDHKRSWHNAGRNVQETSRIEEADFDGISVLVNPNNPTGAQTILQSFGGPNRVWPHDNGWLIVDEAFMDLAPTLSVTTCVTTDNVIVLKSVGKFFGLAGLRLGFVIAPPKMIDRMQSFLGDWPISGPALCLGKKCLEDTTWQASALRILRENSDKLFTLLKQHSFDARGGTDLFALVESERAQLLFQCLLKHKIYVRCFDYNRHWLRIGIPGNEKDFERLKAALADI